MAVIRVLCGLFLFAAAAFPQAPTRIPFICPEEESETVYLELSGIEATLSHLFLVGNLHTADTTLFSILLASGDGGKTWTEPFERKPGSSLEQIQFIDFENGWVSGANVQAVPKDPFLLITNNGGKSWRSRPIFEESRTGVVERFRFESKTAGMVLISTKFKHEILETSTGGESWSPRQSSASPLKLPRDRSDTDLAIRIRADAKLHAYQVERRQNGVWSALASFPVELAKCKE